MECRCYGVLALWSVSIMEDWHAGMFVPWSVAAKKYGRKRSLMLKSVGAMACWCGGVFVLRSVGVEGCLWQSVLALCRLGGKVLRILYKLLPKLDTTQLDSVLKLLPEPMASHESEECRAWYGLVYTHVYTHVYAHVDTHTHVYIHMYTHVYTHVYNTCLYACLYTCLYTCRYTCPFSFFACHVYISDHVRMHMHVLKFALMCMHIYTHTSLRRYFRILIWAYTHHGHCRIDRALKLQLLHGLSDGGKCIPQPGEADGADEFVSIRGLLLKFWDETAGLSPQPAERLRELCAMLDRGVEEHWPAYGAQLLLQVLSILYRHRRRHVHRL